jgi:hypothetical protein
MGSDFDGLLPQSVIRILSSWRHSGKKLNAVKVLTCLTADFPFV